MGTVAGGIEALEKSLQGDEGGSAATILVLSELRAGRITQAAAAAEALVKRDPQDLLVQNLLGIVRGAQGNYGEAADIFKAIVSKDPTLIATKLNLARAYVALHQPADAQAVLHDILKQRSNDVEALTALADIAAEEKDNGAAAAFLTQAQQASPKDPSPGIRLLQLYASSKDWDKLKSAGHSLDGQFPGNPRVIDVIAHLLVEAGDAAGAVDEYKRATEALPNRPRSGRNIHATSSRPETRTARANPPHTRSSLHQRIFPSCGRSWRLI